MKGLLDASYSLGLVVAVVVSMSLTALVAAEAHSSVLVATLV